jgi:tellurite methyltransferase
VNSVSARACDESHASSRDNIQWLCQDGSHHPVMNLPAAWLPLRGADIYLLDHILRGNIRSGMNVLDVGCGHGRNLPALIAAGCAVTAIDPDIHAIAAAKALIGGSVEQHRVAACDIESMPFTPASFDVVVVNAVLHFAPDDAAFHRWADRCWRQLARGGLFLARLSTRIGLPDVQPAGFRYLATEADLIACESRWQARRVDPLKTTLVERVRTMTTWILRQ